MKVRILSGNQAGAVVELDRLEAEAALATGYAEAFVVPVVPEAAPKRVVQAAPARNAAPKSLHRRK